MNSGYSSTLLECFNNLLLKFIEDISELPTFQFVRQNKDIIVIAIETNPQMIMDIFIKYILIYQTQIYNRDENFFITLDLEKVLDKDFKYIGKLFEFKNNWKRLTFNNRNVIIEYLCIFCQLASQYDNMIKS